MDYKKNCITYWLPKLIELKMPIPNTIVVDMDRVDKNFVSGIKKVFWMKKPTEKEKIAFGKFRFILEDMAKKISGYPFFLRTGHSSHKHHWTETCYIANKNVLLRNAQNLAEQSIMVNFKGGLPINVWVARELIKTKPIFEAFDGFPVTLEVRFFFKDKKYQCHHPYWPEDAIEGHTQEKDWKKKLKKINNIPSKEIGKLKELTEKVAKEFNGYWSIDWLKSKDDQWYVLDMATGEDSYHWKGCAFLKRGKNE